MVTKGKKKHLHFHISMQAGSADIS